MKKIMASVIVTGAAVLAVIYLPSSLPRHPAPSALKVSGNIEAHESDLSFKVQGRIKELPVEEGQWVERGTVLARLDDDDYRQQVATNEANQKLRMAQLELTQAGSRTQDIKAAQQSMLDAEADLELKKSDVQRKEDLYKKDAISAETRDIAITALKRARAAYERSKQLYEEVAEGNRKEQIAIDRQSVKEAFENLQASRIKLGYTVLRAPTSGVVLTRQAELGEVVSPGTPILTLADLNDVWLRAYVSETDLGRIRLDQSVRVTTDTYPGKVYRGRLSFISSVAEFTPKSIQTQKERVTLVYKIKIDLHDPSHELKPGMPADATLGSPEDVLARNAPETNAVEAVEEVRPARQPPAKAQEPVLVQVQTVDVTNGNDGTEIQISGNGPLTPAAMRLKDPDRVVIDLPNATWNFAPKLIPVKSTDVSAVRIALHDAHPPMTRLVVDLPEARDYELMPSGNSMRVKLRVSKVNKLQPVGESMQSKQQPEAINPNERQ